MRKGHEEAKLSYPGLLILFIPEQVCLSDSEERIKAQVVILKEDSQEAQVQRVKLERKKEPQSVY